MVPVGNVEDLEARRLAYVSRMLRHWVSGGQPVFQGPGLALVTEWSVWESSELLPLFHAWRSRLVGGGLDLASTPAFAFEPGSLEEAENGVCLLAMAIAFGWGLDIHDADRRLRIDHDGRVEVAGDNHGEIRELSALL